MIHQNFECEFYFIRHGESEANALRGYMEAFDLDTPLTAKGFTQARLLGERLRQDGVVFDIVYSSSMRRTTQTAQMMLAAMGEPEREFPRIDAIVEQQIRGWHGVRTEEALTPETTAYMRQKAARFVPPDVESSRLAQRRFANRLEDEILYNRRLIAAERPLRIAVAGHAAAPRCLLQYILDFDEQYIWKMSLDNNPYRAFGSTAPAGFPST